MNTPQNSTSNQAHEPVKIKAELIEHLDIFHRALYEELKLRGRAIAV